MPGEPEVAAVTVVDTHGRKRSASEVAELTDVEEDISQFDETLDQYTSGCSYKDRRAASGDNR